MEVIKTYPGEEHFHLFDEALKSIYPGSLHSFPSENLPRQYLQGCYILLKNNIPVARAVVYYNENLNFNLRKTFTIGNYDCINDDNVSGFFLNKLFKEIESNGGKFIVGPMNGSTWDNYRFLLTESKDHFFMESYNPVFYNQQFTEAGFQPLAMYSTNIDRSMHLSLDIIAEKERRLGDIHFRNFRLNEFDKELDKLYEFIHLAFTNNFLFTPISKDYFKQKYNALKNLIQEELVVFAENEYDDIVGFVFCYPDISRKTERRIVLKTLARLPEQRFAGLGSILISKIIKRRGEIGFTSIIHAYMIESSASQNISGNFTGEPFQRYAVYGKAL